MYKSQIKIISNFKRKFTEEDDIRIINYFSEKEFLYNPKNEDYYKETKCQKALLELVMVMEYKYTIKEIRDRFKNLKDSFRREYIKTLKNISQNGSMYESLWKYYEKLRFLEYSFSTSTYNQRAKRSYDEEQVVEETDSHSNDESITFIEETPAVKDFLTPVNQQKLNSPPKQLKGETSFKSHKRVCLLSSTESLEEKETLCSLFGKTVAVSMGEMDSKSREYFKLDVQKLIIKYSYPEECNLDVTSTETKSLPSH